MKHFNQLKSLRRNLLLASTAALLSSACDLLPGDLLDGLEADDPASDHPEPNPDALSQFANCEDLLSSIQERTLTSLMVRAEQLRQAPDNYYGEPGILIDGEGVIVNTPIALEPLPPTADMGPLPVDNAVGAASPEEAGGSFSDTTVQVEGIDEADIVKADGDSLYLLEGDVLFKAHAWPAEELEITSATIIEGYPREMYVSDGMALIYSEVYRNLVRETNPEQPISLDTYYYDYGEYTKLTLLDVSGDEPEIVRETYLEGYYQSSRRHGDVVRTVVDDRYSVPRLNDFYVEYFTPFGEPYRQQDIDAQVDAWLERSSWAITETELSDWLPQHFERVDDDLYAVEMDCSNYFEPPNASEDEDRTTGVTSISTLSLEGGAYAPLDTTSFLGSVSRVYANENVVLLADSRYVYSEEGYSQTTKLHRFNVDGMETNYAASGVVPGGLNNQFSLDEYDGVIRLSTTDNSRLFDGPNGEGPENRVFTLSTNGEWLDVLGQTSVFGLNEQIYATRFMGERAYVVTFRQIDPLFVLDLSDPAAPAVVGELKIPGFSNYLFPLGSDHLFAVGRDATEEGFTQGVALQVFDVQDPTSPTLAHRYVYEQEEGTTNLQVDHRAISFDPNSDRVAFPLRTYGNTARASTLEVFNVDPVTGIERLGDVGPTQEELTFEQCLQLMGWDTEEFEAIYGSDPEELELMTQIYLQECSYYGNYETMRRGVFREGVVFGISDEAIYAESLDDLDGDSLATATFPNRYGYGGGTMGTAGSAMMPQPGMGAGGGAMAGGSAGGAGGGSGMTPPSETEEGQAGSAMAGAE